MRSMRIPFTKKTVVFEDVRFSMEELGYELLDGNLSHTQLTALKKVQGTERLLHVGIIPRQPEVYLEWEVRTVGLEFKKHKRNRVEEALFERRLRQRIMKRSGRSGAAA